MKDSLCAPPYAGPRGRPLTQPIADSTVACLQINEWQYGREPGHLNTTMRF